MPADAYTVPMQTRIVRQGQSDPSAENDCPRGLTPLLWSIYKRRGIVVPEETERGLDRLIPPQKMSGIDAAVDVLVDALARQRRILIVGDFDADGATSCALAVTALRAFGCDQVDFLVPNRFTFGYGLTPEIVEFARSRRPDVLVTVDNGISSVAGVAAANGLGWDVIVTDHHLPGPVLPAARALVNPNLPDNAFASKALAGVGVIFYVLLALRKRLREQGWFDAHGIKEPNMAEYLDLVALGTIADVVPLDHNNRILVYQGLRRIRAGQCRPGITALLRVAGRNPQRVREGDIGFAAGPRLNAAGRLDDMSLGIACLLADNDEQALELAQQLDRLNRERQSIEQGMKAQADKILRDWAPDGTDTLPWGLCLYQEDWHQGVIGILAARIKERHHRPVIAFAAADNGELKGSARSIPGLHIRDVLDEIAAGEPGLLNKFGGHAMAAGLSLRQQDFERFSAAFDRRVRAHLEEEDLNAVLHSDGAIPAPALNLETARELRDGGPWGQGFAEPLFDDAFEVLSQRIVGEKHWKLVVRHPQSETALDAIAFNSVERFATLPDKVHMAYRLDENEWQGRVSLQLRVEYLEELRS
jgi:single-stranded-DNA-specific exonuclease